MFVLQDTQNKKRETRPGESLKGALHRISRRSNPTAECGSWQQPPPIRHPLTQHGQHIPTQTEIIRMRLGPLKPGFMPPLKRRHAIVTDPVVATEYEQLNRRPLNRRPTMPRH
jgi:hypothetical protein